MNPRLWQHLKLAAMSLVVGGGPVYAGEPAPQRAAPIVFSEPKSDSVSSNLNQLNQKASPFRALESELKKPFEIFDWGQSAGGFRPPAGPIAPPAPSANNRRIKELMEKRAEMLLLGPESEDSHLADDDRFKTPEDGLEAASSKLKTPLDRYYDQLDRERFAVTNQMRKADVFTEKPDPDRQDLFGRPLPAKPLGGDLDPSVSSLGKLPASAGLSTGFFSGQVKPKSYDDLIGRNLNDPADRRNDLADRAEPDVRETRLDEFKNLLDRPAFVPGSNNKYGSPAQPALGTDQRAAPVLPWSTWSSPSAASATPNPRDSLTSRAGLVGTPAPLQGLPNIAATTPSLNPAPPPIVPPKPPVSSFSIPKRQF